MIRFPVALLGTAMALAASGVEAQSPADVSAGDWARAQLGQYLRPGLTWSLFQQAMRDRFREIDRDGDGISPKDYARNLQAAEAQRRAQIIQQQLARDLDNDGAVSRDELVAFFHRQADQPLRSASGSIEPTAEQRKVVLDKLVADALKDDLDHDGTISFEEMRRAAAVQVEGRRGPDDGGPRVPPSLDADGDGVISAAEWDAALQSAFRSADGDGDGQLSKDEVERAAQAIATARDAVLRAESARRRAAEGRKRAAACRVPVAPAGARLVVVGAYEGAALSTASIGGDDREVTVSRLVIEPGPEPLHLVLSSYDANVWLVTGAVERVAQVFASSQQAGAEKRPRVGVVGVPPERVRFAAEAACLPYFYQPQSREWTTALTTIEALFGRAPDAAVGAYSIATMGVPSGRPDAQAALPGAVALPAGGPARATWAEMLRFNPAGLVSVAPEQVAAPLPVKRYGVLPQEAGLAQLIEEGALKAVGVGRRSTFEADNRPVVAATASGLLILRRVRLPAGLNGAHSVRFVLGRGVPMPEGSPGHSCIVSEETGEPVAAGARC
ncbi:hypothetical protein [Methylobacterium brachiatum]